MLILVLFLSLNVRNNLPMKSYMPGIFFVESFNFEHSFFTDFFPFPSLLFTFFRYFEALL